MSIKSSFAALLLSWSNAVDGTIKDNNQKENTPETIRQAITDLYDTLGVSWFDVADVTTLNSYSLGTNFKEWDIAFVADIGKGDKIGVYQYVRSRATSLLGWKLLFELGEASKLILSTQPTLALYISTDWTNGDLAIGYLVKLTTGQIYMLMTGTGSSTANYQIISDIITALDYQGTWNASTNTPTLVSSTGTKNHYYIVNVAGSTNLDGITDWKVGDWVVFNGSVWQKVDQSPRLIDDPDPTLSADLKTANNRILESQGDDVASANDLTLNETNNGNIYSITGTTQINRIDDANWGNGSYIELKFDGILTLKDGQATGGTAKQINTADGSDITTAAGMVVAFREIDGEWWEVGRVSAEGHDIYADDILQTTASKLNFSNFTVNYSAGDDWNEIVHTHGDETNVNYTSLTDGDIPIYDFSNSEFINQISEEFDLLLNLEQLGISANGLLSDLIPNGYELQSFYINEKNSASAGNISIGTSALGTDVVNANAVGADYDDALTLLKNYFSRTANQQLYISSSGWGSGSVDIEMICRKIWKT